MHHYHEYQGLYDGSLVKGSDEYQALWDKRATAVQEFDTQILQLRTDIYKLNQDKLLLGADEYTREIEKLKTANRSYITELESYDEYTEIPMELMGWVEGWGGISGFKQIGLEPEMEKAMCTVSLTE